jgi:hypothetical protein
MSKQSKAVWLVIRDGQIKLRLVGASVVRGKLRAPTKVGLGVVVDGESAKRDGVVSEITTRMQAGQFDELEARYGAYLLGPGASESGALVIEQSEWVARREREAAARLSEPYLTLNAQNIPVLEVDARQAISVGDVVTELGHRWTVTALGRVFERHSRSYRYAYLRLGGIDEAADLRAAYIEARRRDAEEAERYSAAFTRMMEDEDNDGARPPRGRSRLFAELADALAAADPMTPLFAKATRQAEESPETDLGWIRSKAGKRALAVIRSGGSEQEVRAALDSYQQDPEYTAVLWR